MQKEGRLLALERLRNRKVLDLVERWWDEDGRGTEVTFEMVSLVEGIGLSWPRADDWIRRGRPLSLLALDVLVSYAEEAPPKGFDAPTEADLRSALEAYLFRDPNPRARRAVERILKAAARITWERS